MKRIAMTLAASLFATAAAPGEVADFEAAFRGVYADYRAALFATNTGDAGKSAATLAAFDAGWSGLAERYADAPPPQYADDAEWGGTLATVETEIDAASADVAAGKLPEAHEALEGVRDAIWDLHRRNGVSLFSDRMNAYHAAMEEVLAVDPAGLRPEDMPGMLIHAGVLSYLAGEIAGQPAPEAGSAEYAPLAEAFQASVAAFRAAAESGDPAAVGKAIGALKPAYSKFFLKFG